MRTREELLKEILLLSVAERIELVENIWDTVIETPDALPMTPEQCEELDRRIEEFENSPKDGIRWQDLKAILKSRKTGL